MIYRGRLDPACRLPRQAGAAYARDGVIVLEDFVPPAQCLALRRRALELVLAHAPAAGGTVFSTRDQRHAQDRYFEDSANRIGVFFEDGALDAAGRLQLPLERAVNKLGHAPHDLDPVFKEFSHGAKLQAVADGIGLQDPKVVQSMYIFKQPGIGGEIALHQDASYLYTEPQSVVGFWFALEDAHRGNGCLGGIAGSHRRGLREVFRRQADGQLATELLLPELRFDHSRIEWLEVSAGALLVFDGCFAHLSEVNRSAQSRHAYTLHAVSGKARYRGDNWIQRPADGSMPLRGFV